MSALLTLSTSVLPTSLAFAILIPCRIMREVSRALRVKAIRPIGIPKLNGFLLVLLCQCGSDHFLWRRNGFLAASGRKHGFIAQGVHEHADQTGFAVEVRALRFDHIAQHLIFPTGNTLTPNLGDGGFGEIDGSFK